MVDEVWILAKTDIKKVKKSLSATVTTAKTFSLIENAFTIFVVIGGQELHDMYWEC